MPFLNYEIVSKSVHTPPSPIIDLSKKNFIVSYKLRSDIFNSRNNINSMINFKNNQISDIRYT